MGKYRAPVLFGVGLVLGGCGQHGATARSTDAGPQDLPPICVLSEEGGDCGTCATPCGVGERCLGNVCGQVLVAGLEDPQLLVLGDGQLYFATVGLATWDGVGPFPNQGRVERIQLDGTGRTLIADQQRWPSTLAFAGGTVAWGVQQPPEIWSAPPTGGAQARLAPASNWISALAFLDGAFYWTERTDSEPGSGPSTIRTVPATGGLPSTVAMIQGLPSELVGSNGALHWASDDGTVRRWDSASLTSTVVASLTRPLGLVTGADRVYAADYRSLEAIRIAQIPHQGAVESSPEIPLPHLCTECGLSSLSFGHLTVDGLHAYTEVSATYQEGSQLLIYRMPLDAQAQTSGSVLPYAEFWVPRDNAIRAIVEAGDALYLAISGPNGAILKLKK